MIPLDPASGKDGGSQPSDNGKQFSVTLDQPVMGAFRSVKNRKLASHVLLDRPRLATRLIGVTRLRILSPEFAQQGEANQFPVVVTAQPRAGLAGLMDHQTAETAANPNEGDYYENS